MEKKQKDLISVLLLVVGVVFILVAGSIFVTTAWKYLPLIVKQFALLGVAGGMFFASGKVGRNERLGWISQTLFHVGNAFVGFFIIAIMGGIVSDGVTGNAFKVMVASGVMGMIVALKTIMKKHVSDFVALVLLINMMLISGCIALELSYGTYICMLGGLTLCLALFDAKEYQNEMRGSFFTCLSITYLIHILGYVLLLVPYCLVSLVEKTMMIKGFVMTIILLFVATVSYMTRKNVWTRVMQSIVIGWSVLYLVTDTFLLAEYKGAAELIIMTCILVASVLMVFLNRTEITITMLVIGCITPILQLLYYWFDALFCVFGTSSNEYVATYYPHCLIIGTAFFALYIVRYGCDDMLIALKKSRLLKFAILEFVSGLLVFMVAKSIDTCAMVFCLIFAMDFGFMASVPTAKTVKKMLMTCAVLLYVAAIGCQPFVKIPETFGAEWGCFLITIGIVLFRHIWYDCKEKMSNAYFVVICLMLGYLLLHNLYCGGIGNVLILGMTGIIMLIVAAMGNHKRYVVASSVTLIALVLYLTRAFWLSIAWWVYLFVAGVVLVGLAIKKAKEA
ncbi:MAG: hypothetical protein E7264_06335 [Lachnospiraceae bacterium]|nr:hypothetical protein [Lachnospiraceae bacterium]